MSSISFSHPEFLELDNLRKYLSDPNHHSKEEFLGTLKNLKGHIEKNQKKISSLELTKALQFTKEVESLSQPTPLSHLAARIPLTPSHEISKAARNVQEAVAKIFAERKNNTEDPHLFFPLSSVVADCLKKHPFDIKAPDPFIVNERYSTHLISVKNGTTMFVNLDHEMPRLRLLDAEDLASFVKFAMDCRYEKKYQLSRFYSLKKTEIEKDAQKLMQALKNCTVHDLGLSTTIFG